MWVVGNPALTRAVLGEGEQMGRGWRPRRVRIGLLISLLLLSGCNHGFERHSEQETTPQQMLDRAELVFIGVIEGHHFDSFPFFDMGGSSEDSRFWRPLRRRVRVEAVLLGNYSKPKIDVFEVFWTGGTTGDWNSTQDGQRDLFLVHQEAGRWRIVRDWWRSIYEVHAGYHSRLPLDDSRPFWERYALMGFWIGPDNSGSSRMVDYRNDPGAALGKWRTKKLLRGLLRHPEHRVRIAACVALDETRDPCEKMFSKAEWDEVYSGGRVRRERLTWSASLEKYTRGEFERMLWAQAFPAGDANYTPWAMDELRILTTVDHPVLRREFCQTFVRKFPGDAENGCDAKNPYPATIVTENGDVPLVGAWPEK